MDIQVGDILTMKKAHPCGDKRWLVVRTGADFRLRCLGCGHELMTPRFKAEKNIPIRIYVPYTQEELAAVAGVTARFAAADTYGSDELFFLTLVN